jgi:hypothetical protein
MAMVDSEPDLSKVLLWSDFLSADLPDPDDKEFGNIYYKRASEFLASHDFCAAIKKSYIAMIYPGVIGVFLFRIENKSTFGEWVWVFVGDIPPAVFSLSIGRNPGMALDAYLGEMDMWVDAVKKGEAVDDLVPVNAPPTKEYADMLLSRLDFIGEKILMEDYKDDLEYDPNE